MAENIIIEVGVNNGQNAQAIMDEFPCTYYGFEPVPSCVERVKKMFAGRENTHFIQQAVHSQDGVQEFYLSKNSTAPYSASSLFDFRSDLVTCTRLDTFLDTIEFDEIAFLEADAQGNDIEVFKSLGKYLPRLREGQMELALGIELYDGPDNTLATAAQWLKRNGFEIIGLKTNSNAAECDIRFKRRDLIDRPVILGR
jgi:FkbM family methyltransferase